MSNKDLFIIVWLLTSKIAFLTLFVFAVRAYIKTYVKIKSTDKLIETIGMFGVIFITLVMMSLIWPVLLVSEVWPKYIKPFIDRIVFKIEEPYIETTMMEEYFDLITMINETQETRKDKENDR